MIPKNIFQSWYTINLHPLIKNKIDNMKKMIAIRLGSRSSRKKSEKV